MAAKAKAKSPKGRARSRTTKAKPKTRSKAASKKWIQGAVKHPDAFTAKAKKAGMNVQQYANSVLKPGSKADATTKKQAGLARTFAKMSKKKGK